MTVLSFYSGYLPGEKYGGPVSSLYNFAELLGGDTDVYIVCSNHDLDEKTPYPDISAGWNQVGKAKVKYISDDEMVFFVYNRIIGEVKPDIIYISSIFSAKFNAPIYKVAKKTNTPILLAPRGELNGQALMKGALKKAIYLRYFKCFLLTDRMYFQATSEDEYNDIRKVLNISDNRLCLLPNVPSLPCRKDEMIKQSSNLKMCFVGRVVPNKNLDVCLKALKNVHAEVDFDIFGPRENAQYWAECERIITALPNNIKVNYCGVLGQIEMRKKYGYYDCLISPTQFENYGQAIAEAMLHDTPVIISKATTPWDGIEQYNAGYVIPLEDVAGFSQAIEKLAAMDDGQYRRLIGSLREYVADTFDLEELRRNFITQFRNIQDRGI